MSVSYEEMQQSVLALITTLKLTQKEIHSLEDEAAKWKNRVELARSKGENDLLREAERELERIEVRLTVLKEEEQNYIEEIEVLRRQLPGIAARERSRERGIDPDILEQELLMSIGLTEEEVKTERSFRELEKNAAADAALEELKTKLKGETS